MPITAAYVDTIAVFSIKGVPTLAQMNFALKTRPGLNSHDIVLHGTRGDSFTLQLTHDFTSQGNMKAGIITLSNLVGSIISITDDSGNTYQNMLFEKFNPKRFFKGVKTVGGYNAATGGDSWILEAELTLRHLG